MTALLQYVLLGLGTSAVYVLLGAGVVLINRGSGIVNFAQGAMALVSALLFHSLQGDGVPTALAFLISASAVSLFAVLFFVAVIHPLGSRSPVARTIATLGLLILLQGAAQLIWGTIPISEQQFLPHSDLHILGTVVSADRLILFGIAIALTILLWAASRFTSVGLALRALAENPRATSALGWSPGRLGILTWSAAGFLAAAAGNFIAPISGISTDAMPLLIVPVFAAVLLGSFQSFPLLLVASTAIGVGQSLIANYVSLNGLSGSLPFAVIILILVVRGASVTGRSNVIERLPDLGRGTVSKPWLATFVAGMILLISLAPSVNFLAALANTMAWALIVLSVVIITGYTGQLSLSQIALAGIAALTTARAVVDLNLPFLVACVAGVAVSVAVGLLFALTAIRTRGINLAIVTLGLASVTASLVFTNTYFVGGFRSITVPSLTLFGYNIGPLLYQRRYAFFVFVVFLLVCLAVAALRRGTGGGRLIAVRTNERAASALGINVLGAKLYAFGLAAAVAGTGGILLTFNSPAIDVTGFDPMQSVYAVAYAVAGGLGYVTGASGGAQLAPGGVGSWLLNLIAPSANPLWLQIIGGVVLLVIVRFQPGGLASDWARQAASLRAAYRRLRRVPPPDTAFPVIPLDEPGSVDIPPAALAIDGLTVRFGGGVVAVDDVSLEVNPGEIVALIGPNGAGKSSVIDAITGFVRAAGSIRFNEQEISSVSSFRRARLGIARSFQSLELFESLSVYDNLLAGADKGRTAAYYTDLVHPHRARLGPLASLAVHEFGLAPILGDRVDSLSYGQRRLVAVTRALASEPSLLLLDEPAAGLGDADTRFFERALRVLATRGLTILLVEHDMRFVMDISDRVVVIEAGRYLASGSPEEVRSNPAVISAYLGGAVREVPARKAETASSHRKD